MFLVSEDLLFWDKVSKSICCIMLTGVFGVCPDCDIWNGLELSKGLIIQNMSLNKVVLFFFTKVKFQIISLWMLLLPFTIAKHLNNRTRNSIGN